MGKYRVIGKVTQNDSGGNSSIWTVRTVCQKSSRINVRKNFWTSNNWLLWESIIW